MSHFIYDLVQSLIIISLCLTIVYPKAKERYNRRKKLRETQRDTQSKEIIHNIVNEYLQSLQKDGREDKGTRKGD